MFKLLSEAEKFVLKTSNPNTVFQGLCESHSIAPIQLHESMHLLLTKAIDILNRVDKNDYRAAEEIKNLPMYAIATIMTAGQHMPDFDRFRKEVGDKRPLADFIADKDIVRAPTQQDASNPKSTNAILANFANVHARSAIERVNQAFQQSKTDALARAKLIAALKNSAQQIDAIYTKAYGDKQKMSQAPQGQAPQGQAPQGQPTRPQTPPTDRTPIR